MLRRLKILSILTVSFLILSCETLNIGNIGVSNNSSLTNREVIAGLREALSVGSENAVQTASRRDGFFRHPIISIPFPPQAKHVETQLRAIGLNQPVDRTIEAFNRAAEEASKEAVEIFLSAIRQLSIQDGLTILRSGGYAATNYLKDRTSDQLYNRFKPIVTKATDKVMLTRYWDEIMDRYNQIPFMQPVHVDINDYTTNRAIDGLFHLIGEEERKIRENPVARVSEQLRRVFGSQDN